ncbi:TPA: WYL domain-containing protein [Vibrio parahaemolyticus]|uniref:WYL domain-containing protein n=1 Tax=Vibrio parahaemolyticus TaxID=670 RepID=UPI001121996C|nr:WYL domain-containing protein [Vibrio parahaemolyticus]EGQ9917452.1 WYL domain-containing protein [Vibrio parahaemolyticus]MBE4419785.1 WYL domain-containing protein [Vibrio parahaemolyticus]MDF4358894.1 WYL domain-containing protein [Vibrio parahaemolyticus]MDF4545652.1 WYL domain-containing protein [Vibrio parahaemolyticus]MDF4559508.1 WYL domain-containing protein [Vibrio parahaemolyticus]
MSELYSYTQLVSEVGSHAERLAYIDFKLRFTGFIRRADLKEEFGLAEAAATRMISLYREYREENLVHDRSNKLNVINLEKYTPLIPIGAEQALGMLAHGFNKNKLAGRPILQYRKIGVVKNQLDVDEVARITRAISNEKAIECCYISGSSDKHLPRDLVPLAILYDGKNWIFRAFDRSETKKYKFKNFNFARATKVKPIEQDDGNTFQYERLSEDTHWNTPLPLFLELHNELNDEQRASIRRDFGMLPDEDELYLTESAALVWILTKLWNIDVGNPEESDLFFKFSLKNREMIKPYL